MVKRSYSILLCLVLGLGASVSAQNSTAGSLSPDQDELASAQKQGANIAFIDYTGPETSIQSSAQIRSIGTGLGSAMGRSGLKSGRTGEEGRYWVIRAVDSAVPQGFDADILILGPGAQVDKIRNLRSIIAGYLSSAWGYSAKDASTLAVYITVYNAVHRGGMDYFSAHYKPVVMKELSAENAGLSTRYDEWPGKTRIVIPLSANAKSGKLGAVETGAISDKATTENLRAEPGSSVGERQDMTDLQQREVDQRSEDLAAKNEELDKRQAAVDQEKADIAKEQQQLDAQKQASAQAHNGAAGQQGGTSSAQNQGTQGQNGAAGGSEAAQNGTADAQNSGAADQNQNGTAGQGQNGTGGNSAQNSAVQNADNTDNNNQQQADVQSKETELNKRQEAANQEQAQIDKEKQQAAQEQQQIDQKQNEVNQSRQDIAADQQKTINEEVASKDQGAAGSVFVFQVLSPDSSFARIMRFNPKSGALLSASALNTIHSRAVVEEADSYVLIAGKDGGGGAVRLERVDKKSLTASVEGQDDLFADSALWKIGDFYYAVGKAQNGGCHLLRFNADLKLAATSNVTVIPYTMLSQSADGLVVQTPDGSFAVISKDKLEKISELKP